MAVKPKNYLSAAWQWIGPGGKWKLLLGALTALAILAYVVSLKLNLAACQTDFANYQTSVAKERSDALETASTARQSANGARSEARHQVTADHSTKRKQLDAALEANRAWADQPVPSAVIDSLR